LFNFYINGQTGEVQGRSPVSFWKVLAAVLIGLAVIGLIIWFVQMNGGFQYSGGSYY
jgi:small-conductance mechanosensitive channel